MKVNELVQQMQQSERQFRVIFDQTFQLTSLLTPEGILLETNQTALDFIGLPADAVLGQPFWKTAWWNSSPQIQAQLQDAIANAALGKFVRYEVELPDVDGKLHAFDFSLKPVKDETGQLVLIAESRDITEIKQTEAEIRCQSQFLSLRQANEELEIALQQQTAALTKANRQLEAEMQERQRVEAALRQSEEQFQSLSACSPIGIFLTDVEGRCNYTNRRCQAICGFTLEESLGEGWSQFVHPDDRCRVFAEWFEYTREGREYSDEFRVQPREGIVRWVRVRSSPMFSERGELLGHVGTVEDISQSKQAENTLQESEQRFRQLAENIHQVFWMTSLAHTQMLYVSPAYEEIWGKSRQELYEQPSSWMDAVHPDDRSGVMSALKKQLQGNYDREYRIVRPDGSIRWIRSRAFPVRDEAGRIYRIAGIAEDITSQKQAEVELHTATSWLTAVIQNIQVGILLTNESRQVLLVNEEFCRMFGFAVPPQDLIGMMCYQLAQECQKLFSNPEQFMQRIDEVLVSQQIHTNEELYLADGRTLEWDYVPIFIEENYCGHVWMYRDITQRKQVEEEMRKAFLKEKELSNLKSRFITTTSHEFRTPLTTILLSSEILKERSHKLTPEKKLIHFERIKVATMHMTQMLEDILLVGKGEAEKLQFNPVMLDLENFCRNLVEEQQLAALSKRHISLVNRCDRTHAKLDEKLLSHILTNLLSNAMKYSPHEGTVVLELYCQDKALVFQIKDRGIGIPKQDQQRLFESFHRASNVGNISGTGLGLAIVKKCVDLHSGQIAFVSEVGAGTTFTVTIPWDD